MVTSGESHFFGFHDLSPWSPNGDRLLCLRTETAETGIPHARDVADIVVIREDEGTVQRVGATTAWNWQQGARQRWLDRRRIAYNRRTDHGVAATIADTESGETVVLDTTLSDVSPDGRTGVTVNFLRLGRLYDSYGYAVDATTPLPSPHEDGLFTVDLAEGTSRLVLTIADVAAAVDGKGYANRSYFTHASFSPSGKRVCFIYRRSDPSGALINNLIVLDLGTFNWRVIASDRVSHFDWESDDKVVAWCRMNRAVAHVKSIRIPGLARLLYRASRRITGRFIRRTIYGESFRRIDVVSGDSERFGAGIIDEDGHPMINPKHSHIWVNDTYPDGDGFQTLMLYDAGRNVRIDLLRLPTPRAIAGTAWRCDLHPRWDPSGTRICVDSAHAGRRQLCVLDVSPEIERLSS